MSTTTWTVRPDVNSSGETIAHFRSRQVGPWVYVQKRKVGSARWIDVRQYPA